MRALWDRPVAHRGLHGPGRPENSLSALAAACEHGLPVELDVRVTSDGVAVLHHDVDLLRLCGLRLRVAEMPARAVTLLHLQGTEERVATLADALDLVAGAVPVLVDCKVAPTRRARARMLEAVLPDLRRYRGEVGVVGFDPWLFAMLREQAPRVLRGLSAGVSSYDARFPRVVRGAATPLDRFWLAAVSQPHFLTYNVARLPQPALARLRETGLPVLGWTVRDVAQLALVEGQVDNVIAEGPAMEHLLRQSALAG